MTLARFSFQRECVERALENHWGVALNIGCNTDYGALKAINPARVINCDLYAELDGEKHAADVLFDAAWEMWPFDSGSAAIVVLGDILEHMTPADIESTLDEARRVSARLCITVPEDHRDGVSDEEADKQPRGRIHRTVVMEELLHELLDVTGWRATGWQVVEYGSEQDWGMLTMGHFVEAE